MYDIKDERGVPVSTGIPPIVRWAAFIGFIIILTILSFVIFASNYHHIWPASNTTHIKLD
jgi:hypothetical protein